MPEQKLPFRCHGILRKYELLQNDDTITEKEAVWSLDGDGVIHIDL